MHSLLSSAPVLLAVVILSLSVGTTFGYWLATRWYGVENAAATLLALAENWEETQRDLKAAGYVPAAAPITPEHLRQMAQILPHLRLPPVNPGPPG